MAKGDKRKYRLHIKKDALKFAAAHMTVFPDGHKEALHGHNYTVELTVELAAIGLDDFVSFDVFKQAIKKICAGWDEKVLLPKLCHFLKIHKSDDASVDFTLCQKHYVLPKDEVEWLPVDNVTAETLANEVLTRLIDEVKTSPEFATVRSLETRVDETPGQGASCRWKNHD